MRRAAATLPLRTRLALLLAIALLSALAAMIVLTDGVYAQLQQRQLEALLERDLDRVAALVRTGAVGQAFVDDEAGAVRLQFVSNAGAVQLPDPDATPIPLTEAATRVQIAGVPWLVSSEPWVLPSGLVIGSIRMALDLREPDASRTRLRVALLASAIAIAVLAGAVMLTQLRRALLPLTRLASQTRTLDPARPSLEPYVGPDDEVAQLAGALERALDAIRARQQAERSALAEVAHELAAPLTVVAGELRAVARRLPDDPRVEAARAAADELLHTSQDLLTLARGELEVPMELELVDVGAAVRSVTAEYPGVGVTIDAGDLRVLAELQRLRQVVRNLVRNAVQACGRADGVAVRVWLEGQRVLVEVRDDGPGLDPAAIAHVFERFYSGRRGGVGVGLAVVQRLVEAMGGRASARSVPGDTRFRVELPSFVAQLADDDPAPPGPR